MVGTWDDWRPTIVAPHEKQLLYHTPLMERVEHQCGLVTESPGPSITGSVVARLRLKSPPCALMRGSTGVRQVFPVPPASLAPLSIRCNPVALKTSGSQFHGGSSEA